MKKSDVASCDASGTMRHMLVGAVKALTLFSLGSTASAALAQSDSSIESRSGSLSTDDAIHSYSIAAGTPASSQWKLRSFAEPTNEVPPQPQARAQGFISAIDFPRTGDARPSTDPSRSTQISDLRAASSSQQGTTVTEYSKSVQMKVTFRSTTQVALRDHALAAADRTAASGRRKRGAQLFDRRQHGHERANTHQWNRGGATSGSGLVTQDPSTQVISVGKDKAGTTIAIGGTSGNRVMTGVAPGAISATSSDAINGAQLFNTNQQVASLGQTVQGLNLSGLPYLSVHTNGAPANATGTGSVAVGGGAVASGERASAFGDSAVASGNNSVALGADSVADRDNAVSIGSTGRTRQLTNLAAGTAPTDAVNVGQLNNAMSGMNDRVDTVDRTARRGIASASALNIVTPYLPGRTTLNAGVASYRGQAALGIGVSRWNQKGNINFNLGVSTAGGNSTIVRAGIGIVFGA